MSLSNFIHMDAQATPPSAYIFCGVTGHERFESYVATLRSSLQQEAQQPPLPRHPREEVPMIDYDSLFVI